MSSNQQIPPLVQEQLAKLQQTQQNFQSIQAKDGAFRPGDEEQSSGFGRIRANLMLKFHINEYITADIDIAEEPNDFGGGDHDFSFHNDFAGI